MIRLYKLPQNFFWFSFVSTAIILGVYLASMAHTVYFEDSGLFGMVCATSGVAHPPSFPLYTLTCPIFANLPIVSPIHGVAIYSALAATLCCFVLALIVTRLTGLSWAGVIAALTFGFSDSFWSQAIIQEVYSLNALLVFLALWRVIEFSIKPHTKNFYWMVFCSILGLTNHWPLMVLSAISFPIIIAPVWREFFTLIFSRHGIGMIGLTLLILSLYSYTYFRSIADPLISFYGPIESWSEFWFMISRKGYSSIDNSGGNWLDKLDYLQWLFESLVSQQITWLGLILLPLGLYYLYKKFGWFMVIGLLVTIAGSSVLLLLLLHFKFNDFLRSVFRVYPLVSWGIFSLLVGTSIAYFFQWFKKKRNLQPILTVFLIIPIWLFIANFENNWQPKITWAHKQAMVILNSLEKNAILYTHDDTQLPLMYLNIVEKIRPDVTIYNTQSLILNNRLTKAIKKLKYKKAVYRQLAKQTSRPFYTFFNDENPLGTIDNGIYLKGTHDLDAKEKTSVVDQRFFDLLKDGKDAFLDKNEWSSGQKFKYAKNLSKLLLKLPFDDSKHKKARQTLLSIPYGQFSYANTWFDIRVPASEKSLAFKLIRQVEPMVANLPPYQQSRYYNTLGRVQSVEASKIDYQKVEEIFLKGESVYPKNDNPAVYSLLELYAQTKNDKLFQKYTNDYPNSGQDSDVIQAYLKGEEYIPPKPMTEDEAQQKINKAIQYLQNQPSKPKEALKLASEVNLYYPNNHHVIFVLGGAYMLEKNYEKAEQLFLQVIELEPDFIQAMENLSKIYIVRKKYSLLPPLIQKALDIESDNSYFLNLSKKLTKNTPKTDE